MSFQFEPEEDELEDDSSRRTTAIVLGMVAAFLIVVPLLILFLFVDRDGDGGSATPTTETQVVFDDPRTGDNLQLDEEIDVLLSAQDSVGIDQVELKVGGRTLAVLGGEEGVGEPPQFTFQWTPDRLGSQRLDAVATNLNGDISDTVSITVNIVDGDETETPTPTDTETETPTPTETETETETPTPSETEGPREGALAGVANTPANVRESPDETSARVGGLEVGARVEVVGRNEDSTWAQIIFPFDSDDTAWVFAQFVDVDGDINDLDVTSEEEPTETPTETPTEEPEGVDLVPAALSVQSPTNTLVLTLANDGGGDFEGGPIAVQVDLSSPPEDESETVALVAPEIAAGDSVDIPISGVEINSTRTVDVFVDSSNAVEETDEDNNVISEELGAAVEADLAIGDFNLIQSDNHIVVSISNNGDAALNGADIRILIEGPHRVLADVTRSITIEPGGTLSLDITEAIVTADAEVTVTIDADEAVADSDRSNNTMTKQIDLP